MQESLKTIVAAALQKCRQAGAQSDALELAYWACLIEEQHGWTAQGNSTAAAAAAATAGGADHASAAAQAAGMPGPAAAESVQQVLTLCTSRNLHEGSVSLMAAQLSQAVLQPRDPVAAATARLQIALERSFKEQQDKMDAEQTQQLGTTGRLASNVAYKKVNLQVAGLPLYQSVFEAVVDYVCAAAGLGPKAAVDASARAQVAAALQSTFPLSSVAYFLTLPGQERLQQLEALAAISCGICLFNAFTGAALSPLNLSAATQLLQADRLLADIKAAAAQADAALQHYNTMPQNAATATGGGAAGSSNNGSSSREEDVKAASGSRAVNIGGALYCCQVAVALRRLAVDLSAGICCCRQLHEELESVLGQATQLAGSIAGATAAAVSKEAVFPLFESAGRLHQALTGELRLLLVRARLWESICETLKAAAAADPRVPRVLGFTARRRSCYTSSCSGGQAAAGESTNFDTEQLPPGMEYVPPPTATAAAASSGSSGGSHVSTAAEQQQLALSGVCPISLACSVAAGSAGVSVAGAVGAGSEQDRALVGCLAKQDVGAIRYEGHLYGFSSPIALAAFVRGPESVLDAVSQAMHNAPLMLHMLGLTSPTLGTPSAQSGSAAPGASRPGTSSARPGSASAARPASAAGAPAQDRSRSTSPAMARLGAPSPSSGGSNVGSTGGSRKWCMPHLRALIRLLEVPLKVDAGTQTVTHVVERFIDVNYEWNEWALRRRIMALTNLHNKSTHSAQTLISSFRRDGDSQTWLPKEAAVQTKVNKGSSVPRKLRYITGTPGTKIKVVSLELDVHGRNATVKQQ